MGMGDEVLLSSHSCPCSALRQRVYLSLIVIFVFFTDKTGHAILAVATNQIRDHVSVIARVRTSKDQ